MSGHLNGLTPAQIALATQDAIGAIESIQDEHDMVQMSAVWAVSLRRELMDLRTARVDQAHLIETLADALGVDLGSYGLTELVHAAVDRIKALESARYGTGQGSEPVHIESQGDAYPGRWRR